jgi:hypothetical protein
MWGGRQVMELADLSVSEGFFIQGDRTYDGAGMAVSSAGDVNGDGFDDLMIGAPFTGDSGAGAGRAFVLYGTADGFGSAVGGRQVLDLTGLPASAGFIVVGDVAASRTGQSVSVAGDVNGDGYDDLIIGARDGEGPDGGQTYVVFGTGSGFGTEVAGQQILDLASLSASEGFVIRDTTVGGEISGRSDRRSVSNAGDINGDGYDDLIIGSSFGDDGGVNAGDAYVVFGTGGSFGSDSGGRQVIDLASLGVTEGFRIQGDTTGDYAGFSVSSAGDVNGDGFDDLMVGAPFGDDAGLDAGEAYIIFGRATGTTGSIAATGTAGANTMIGGAGDDTLAGAGGADMIRAGAGDDIIGVSDNGFLRIDGGRGDDTLRIDGAGVNLNFDDIVQNVVTDIERIDLTGSGNNTLTVSALDIFDMMEARSAGSAVLRVTGNVGDAAYLSDAGWASSGQRAEGSITYNTYTNGHAQAWIEVGVAVSLGSAGPSLGAVMTLLDANDGHVIWDGGDAVRSGIGFGVARPAPGLSSGDLARPLTLGPRGDQHHLADLLAETESPGIDIPLPAAASLPGFAVLTHISPPTSIAGSSLDMALAPAHPPFDAMLIVEESPFEAHLPEAVDGWH